MIRKNPWLDVDKIQKVGHSWVGNEFSFCWFYAIEMGISFGFMGYPNVTTSESKHENSLEAECARFVNFIVFAKCARSLVANCSLLACRCIYTPSNELKGTKRLMKEGENSRNKRWKFVVKCLW